jgi:hypothetical protein
MTYVAKVGKSVLPRTSCYIRNTLLSYNKNSEVGIGNYRPNTGILHLPVNLELGSKPVICCLCPAHVCRFTLSCSELLGAVWGHITSAVLKRTPNGPTRISQENHPSAYPDSGSRGRDCGTQPAATRSPSFCFESLSRRSALLKSMHYTLKCKMNPISIVQAAESTKLPYRYYSLARCASPFSYRSGVVYTLKTTGLWDMALCSLDEKTDVSELYCLTSLKISRWSAKWYREKFIYICKRWLVARVVGCDNFAVTGIWSYGIILMNVCCCCCCCPVAIIMLLMDFVPYGILFMFSLLWIFLSFLVDNLIVQNTTYKNSESQRKR